MAIGRALVMASTFGAFMAALACSGGGGGSTGSPGLTTSVPPSKEVGQLTTEESKQYCTDLGNFVNASLDPIRKKTSCLREATQAMRGSTTESELRSKCSTAYQECMNKPAAAGATIDVGDCSKNVGQCKATVAEVNKCFEDYVGVATSLSSQLDGVCSAIQLDGGGAPSSQSTSPPQSCTAISQKCPGIGGESDDQTSGDTNGN